MEQKAKQLFAEYFKLNPSNVTDATSPEDVKGWNSLGHLGLVETLESGFGIQFQDSDIAEMDSFGQVVAALHRRGAKA